MEGSIVKYIFKYHKFPAIKTKKTKLTMRAIASPRRVGFFDFSFFFVLLVSPSFVPSASFASPPKPLPFLLFENAHLRISYIEEFGSTKLAIVSAHSIRRLYGSRRRGEAMPGFQKDVGRKEKRLLAGNNLLTRSTPLAGSVRDTEKLG